MTLSRIVRGIARRLPARKHVPEDRGLYYRDEVWLGSVPPTLLTAV
jgi:hypothetical protein